MGVSLGPREAQRPWWPSSRRGRCVEVRDDWIGQRVPTVEPGWQTARHMAAVNKPDSRTRTDSVVRTDMIASGGTSWPGWR